MTTQIDYSVGLVKEPAYGTTTTTTRYFESPATMKYVPEKTQSKMFRPSKRVNRLNRNVLKHVTVSGDMNVEAATKGFGFLLEAVLGVVTNTLIASTSPNVYQQVHTIRKTDPVQSYTLQEVLPMIGGSSANPHTFSGCVADSIELSAKEGGILDAKIAWLGRDMDTTTAAAAASYPVGDELFTFVGGSIGYAGTLTAPTATALGSLSSAVSNNIKDFSVSIDNNLDTGGFNSGGSGKRSRANLLGAALIKGKILAEYWDNSLRDAYIAQSPLPLVLTFTTATVLSATPSNTYAVLQVIIPAVLLKGEIPLSKDGNPIEQSIDFEGFDNGASAEPIWIVYRTLDVSV
jgi:hypothetical protein